MKWIFKNQYVEVPTQDGYRTVNICTGGSFLPEKEGGPMYELTDKEVILRNKDYNVENLNWLSGFFGGNGPRDKGYVSKWPTDYDENAKLYYFVQDGIIHKMIICEYDGLGLSNVVGHQYIMEYNGNAMDMMPEDGDIIYDNYEEAQKDLQQQ